MFIFVCPFCLSVCKSLHVIKKKNVKRNSLLLLFSPLFISLTVFLFLWCMCDFCDVCLGTACGFTHLRMCVCVCKYTSLCVCSCLCLCMCLYVYACLCVCVHTTIGSWRRSRRRLPAAPPSRGRWARSPRPIRAPLKSAPCTKTTPSPPPTRTSTDSVSQNPLWFWPECAP